MDDILIDHLLAFEFILNRDISMLIKNIDIFSCLKVVKIDDDTKQWCIFKCFYIH